MSAVTAPLLTDESDLPEGWDWSYIGSIFSELRNGTTVLQNKEGKGVPVSRIETLQGYQFNLNRIGHIKSIDPDLLQNFQYRPGDISFSHINSFEHVGKTALYMGSPPVFLHGMNLLRLRLGHSFISPDFLHLYMQSDRFRNDVRDRVTHAVNQVSINQKRLSEVPIPIAPLAEQKRIVTKLEELLARVKAARERLARIPTILKRFRQSVLAAACSGRLTEDWRGENPDPESIDAVVKAVRKRRESEAYSAAQKEKLLLTYNNVENNDSSELPNGWCFVNLNKLCESFDYGTSSKSELSGKVPVLRMGNIQSGEIDWTNLAYTSDREEIRKYALLPNTVLFNRTNSPELVGKAAIYRGERDAIFAGYLIRISNLPELDPCYLNLCLNTTYAREFCARVKTDGVSQSNINAQKLGTFEIPFCRPDEQHEIVRRVEALFKLADAIEKRVSVATARAERLTQAILAKAFRDELVPTEAELARREGRSYEPASVLLDRIRAERESSTTQKKAGKSRRATGKRQDSLSLS